MRSSDPRLAGWRGRRPGRLPRGLGNRLRRQQYGEPSRCGLIVDDETWGSAVGRIDLEIAPLKDEVDEIIGSDELELDPVAASRRSSPVESRSGPPL